MAKVPALPRLPPSPLLLKAWVPEKFRPLAFAPVLLVAGFLVFFVTGLVVGEFDLALVAGLVAGPVLAYLAVGAPVTREQLARVQAKVPRAPPDKRPFLFFPAALVAVALLYFAVGFVITTAPLGEDLLALVAMAVAIPAGVGLGYLLFGFPRPKGGLRGLRELKPLEKVPAEKRPLLFFPFGLLLAAPLYILLGFGFTEALDPDLAVLLALLLALVLGFGAAYRLVGVPKPTALLQRARAVEVPARVRPVAFLAFVLVVGTALAVALGGTLGALDFFSTDLALDLAFPLFLLAGWLLAVPAAGRLFGYPVPQQPLRAYLPRVSPEVRPAALLPLTLGLGVLLMFVLGTVLGLLPLAGLEDAYLAALLAFPLALLVSLRVLRVSAREVDPRGLARTPEAARPFVVLGLWLFVGTLLYTVVGQVSDVFLLGVAVSYAAGLVVALVLVDRPLLEGALEDARARRRKEKEIEARLRREMGLAAPEEPQPQAAGGGRFRRRGRGKA